MLDSPPQTTALGSPAELRRLSRSIRLKILEVHARASGHLGSSLSIVELLAVVFARHFRWPGEPMSNGLGDRFVLSKGHAALGLYCALEEFGQIPHRRLAEFGRSGARLEPHPNAALEPAVHASTGSLGQGLSIAAGMALGSRLQDRADRTFVIIGDGEANEGQIWEAARSAAFLRLSNLVVLLDENQLQQDGRMEDILPVTDLAAAWEGMGWRCTSTDGHDVEALDGALSELLACEGQPKLLCARSIKGKGVPFLEGRPESHYPPPLSADDLTLVRYLIEAGSKNE